MRHPSDRIPLGINVSPSESFWSFNWSTIAVAMGNIMAVVAALHIHNDRNHVVNIRPSISLSIKRYKTVNWDYGGLQLVLEMNLHSYKVKQTSKQTKHLVFMARTCNFLFLIV